MNPFGTLTPPGCGYWDTGTSDEYFCSVCDRQVDPSEIDDEASEAFKHVCIECAEQEREESKQTDTPPACTDESEFTLNTPNP
jgi:hypothetical protein